jgi:hypothetical protein
MGGIYGVRRRDWLRCHVVYTKFHKDWLWFSKDNSCGDTKIHRQHGDLIGLLLFFQNRESKLVNFREEGIEDVNRTEIPFE